MIGGILILVGASLCFGCHPSFVKLAYLHGLDQNSIGFFQSIFLLLAIALLAAKNRESFRGPKREILKLILLGMIGIGGAELLLCYAYTLLPVGTASMLHFLYPTIVLLLMNCVIEKKRLTWIILAACLSCIAGLFLLNTPEAELNTLGVVTALASAVAYAIFIISSDLTAKGTFSETVRLFYLGIGGAIVFAIQTAVKGYLIWPDAPTTGGILLLSCLCYTGGFYLIIKGVSRVGAETGAFINMLEPITSMAAGILFYHDPFTAKTGIGCVLILISMLLVTLKDKHTKLKQ